VEQPAATPPPRRLRDASRSASAAASTTVVIRDFEFVPASVTIDVGDTVTWRNEGPTPHSATAEDGSFDTGIFARGGSRSQTFQEAGAFSYICTPHPYMTGTVTVRAASAGGDDSGGTGGAGESTADDGAEGDTGSTAGDGAAGAGTDSGGPALPATGVDAGGLAVLGLATLALGAWLRRSTPAAH
ncbi:MAG: cupredoxin domain-containing protein, partial [Thermoleophilaceae bacterium]